MKGIIKQLLLFLMAFSFLLVIDSNIFSQTKSGKSVKCRENGKIVYRKKCSSKKKTAPPQTVMTDKYGEPNSKYDIASDGPGTGAGQGTGRGTGQGSGVGTGSGQGTGSGTSDEKSETPPKPDGVVTTALKIVSKPRVEYTPEARDADVQGTVTLRITFLADGTIGSISPVQGLPHGLTNQAVEAARKIRFEPAMKNGKPYTVVKLVQYSFTLY